MDELTPDSAETQSLLRQVQAGDRRAFEQLFARHQSDLRQFVALRLDPKLRARLDPSDVVQETQLEVFQRLGDFLERRPMPFRLWLRKTAYERLLKLRRRHLGADKRAVDREVRLPDRSSLLLAQQLLAAGSTPSQHLSRREIARCVGQAVAQLPETDREILLMRNFEGLSYQEISCLLDLDAAAARKRYGRALLRLRQLLADSGLLESQP
jgi:RNA polymerase sigma-70 factor (ECF subfamily)